jgi:hypothetical protein
MGALDGARHVLRDGCRDDRYCRFYEGRRSEDDERQIGAW